MLIIRRFTAALFLVAALIPTIAHASSLEGIFPLQAAFKNKADISVVVLNKARVSQDVKADGHVYTLVPGESVSITAPAGTTVYAGSASAAHQAGVVLFQIVPAMKDGIVAIK
jgi:hypothetical protein